MKKRKVEKKLASVLKMWAMLKKDFKNGKEVSYSFNSLNMIVNGERVEWRLDGTTLNRYSNFVWTLAESKVSVFNFQGVFGKYLACMVAGEEGERIEMFRVW